MLSGKENISGRGANTTAQWTGLRELCRKGERKIAFMHV